MATVTAHDVVIEAMIAINYAAPGQAPEGQDYATALKHYKTFHKWLMKEFERDLRWSYDAVNEDVWTYVAMWFSNRLSRVFPTDREGRIRMDEAAAIGERSLREMLARRPTNTTQAEYY